MTRIFLPALLSLALLPFAGHAQQPAPKGPRGDPQNGEALAKRWCASCHVISKDQTRALDGARPFAAIAQSPDFSVDQLAFFLLDPHPVMPNMTLSRNEARDLAAYIATQK